MVKYKTQIDPDTAHKISDFKIGDKVVYRSWEYHHVGDTKGYPVINGGYGYIRSIDLNARYQFTVYFPLLKKCMDFGEHNLLVLK